MSVTRADREASLKKRYAGRVAAAPKRRGMGRGPGAPRGGGRPKSTGAALKRLLSYLEADRLRMGIAFFCVIVNMVATLTGSYMLRRSSTALLHRRTEVPEMWRDFLKG